MKKGLMILGGIFSVLLLGAVCFFGYSAFIGKRYDASSKHYIEKTLPLILQADATGELLKYASPQLVAVIDTKKDEVDFIFKKLAELGKFDKIADLKGDSIISITPQTGRVVTARYVAQAIFEKGHVSLSIHLAQDAEQWRISGFYVNS